MVEACLPIVLLHAQSIAAGTDCRRHLVAEGRNLAFDACTKLAQPGIAEDRGVFVEVGLTEIHGSSIDVAKDRVGLINLGGVTL